MYKIDSIAVKGIKLHTIHYILNYKFIEVLSNLVIKINFSDRNIRSVDKTSFIMSGIKPLSIELCPCFCTFNV